MSSDVDSVSDPRSPPHVESGAHANEGRQIVERNVINVLKQERWSSFISSLGASLFMMIVLFTRISGKFLLRLIFVPPMSMHIWYLRYALFILLLPGNLPGPSILTMQVADPSC